MDLIAALISMLIVEPIQSNLAETLRDARAPQAVVSNLSSCARDAGPLIVERATADPWWAVSSAVGVWIGTTRADQLLVEAAPNCASAVTAARPFLGDSER